MRSIGISDFKAKCIGVLKEAHRTGKPLVVTLRGRPLVRIEPIGGAKSRRRELGALRDKMTIQGDIVHFGFAGDWEMEK